MPTIRASADLRNNYAEISDFCHKNPEPVFITKNGQGDLAVMSIETYEMLINQIDLFKQINEGIQDLNDGKISEAATVIDRIKFKLNV